MRLSDFQTLEDDTVTIRDRDTAKQERAKTDKIKEILLDKMTGEEKVVDKINSEGGDMIE